MSNCGSVIGGLNCEGFIRDMVGNGYTHQAIASELQRLYTGRVGLSTRSVRKYCSENNIHYSSRLSDQQVEDLSATGCLPGTHTFALCSEAPNLVEPV